MKTSADAAACKAVPEKKVVKTAAALKKTIEHSTSFLHKFQAAANADAPTLILLHGSGGDETSLMALAGKVAPGAALLGIRGRVVQEGVNRWYKRLTPTSFDQTDIRAEADAFAAFLRQAQRQYQFDLSNAVFLGYSNGANLLAALSVLHPDLVNKAALLRPMQVLNTIPDEVKLGDKAFLTVAGQNDATYGPLAPKLNAMLSQHGATVDNRVIGLGHLLGDDDAREVRTWLASLDRPSPANIKPAVAVSAANTSGKAGN